MSEDAAVRNGGVGTPDEDGWRHPKAEVRVSFSVTLFGTSQETGCGEIEAPATDRTFDRHGEPFTGDRDEATSDYFYDDGSGAEL